MAVFQDLTLNLCFFKKKSFTRPIDVKKPKCIETPNYATSMRPTCTWITRSVLQLHLDQSVKIFLYNPPMYKFGSSFLCLILNVSPPFYLSPVFVCISLCHVSQFSPRLSFAHCVQKHPILPLICPFLDQCKALVPIEIRLKFR